MQRLIRFPVAVVRRLIWPIVWPLREAKANLRLSSHSKHSLQTFFEQSLVGLYIIHHCKIRFSNQALAHMLGFEDPSELVGLDVTEMTHPDDVPLLEEQHRLQQACQSSKRRFVCRARKRCGEYVWLETHGSTVEFNGQRAMMGTVVDVSHQFESKRQSRLANTVFESANEGIMITDADYRIVAVNPSFTRITGYTEERAVGRLSRMFTGQVAELENNRQMMESLLKEGHWQGETYDRRRSGAWYPVWISISAVRDHNGDITNYVGVFTDYTDRKDTENQLKFLADHDSLTGLLNRSSLMNLLTLRIAQASQDGRQLCLLFIDLDRFKQVNDTLGHDIGDRLLITMAQRMRHFLRHDDVAARLGGDEFVVLLDNVTSPSIVGDIAWRLIAGIAAPVTLDNQEMFVTASIGIACYPSDGEDAATLLKNADIAMYRAKERGRNLFQFFSKEMNSQALEKLHLENSLHRALERNEFELYYQPQICIESERVIGAEALLRWRHPVQGLIAPDTFIPLAEQSGMIVSIGNWVLETACLQARAWLDAGYHFERVSVNLSARQFSCEELVETIETALVVSGLPPAHLELEITESAIVYNPQEAILLLHKLRDMGITLSIDDFGTGYSSLATLKQFPVQCLKIDRSFISGTPHNSDDIAITEAIIAIAQKMKLKVVAEGVETPAQLDYLRQAGCRLVQGYLFSKPLPASEMDDWLTLDKSVNCCVPA